MATFRLVEIKQQSQLTRYHLERKTWIGWLPAFRMGYEIQTLFYDKGEAFKEYERALGLNEPEKKAVIKTNE